MNARHVIVLVLAGAAGPAAAVEAPWGPPAAPVYAFGALDGDDDGRLTAEEARFVAPLARNFAFADRDGDGRLDRAEYDEAMTLEAEILEAGEHSVRKLALFRELDADRDGALSRAEAAARPALARSFDAADTDGDRRVDRGEFSEVGLDTLAAGGS